MRIVVQMTVDEEKQFKHELKILAKSDLNGEETINYISSLLRDTTNIVLMGANQTYL